MNRRLIVLLAAVATLLLLATTVSAGNRNGAFTANLKGSNERPTPVETDAVGQAIVRVTDGGQALSFKLIVANIENAAAAHIHCGTEDVAGPVGVTLYGGPPTSDNGILAHGVAAPDPGNACGWEDGDDVVAAIEAKAAYVNVHTPANPGGEIRGQLS